jgi:hypothetical protein
LQWRVGECLTYTKDSAATLAMWSEAGWYQGDYQRSIQTYSEQQTRRTHCNAQECEADESLDDGGNRAGKLSHHGGSTLPKISLQSQVVKLSRHWWQLQSSETTSVVAFHVPSAFVVASGGWREVVERAIDVADTTQSVEKGIDTLSFTRSKCCFGLGVYSHNARQHSAMKTQHWLKSSQGNEFFKPSQCNNNMSRYYNKITLILLTM